MKKATHIFIILTSLFFWGYHSNAQEDTPFNIDVKAIKQSINKNDSVWLKTMKLKKSVNIFKGNKLIETDIGFDEWTLSTNFYTRCNCLENTEYTVFEDESKLVISLYYLTTDQILNLEVTDIPEGMILYFDRKCHFKGLKKR
jgi:hypothetical protein